ncbi:alkyl/aryl-sulfatase [Amycolatopsis endophytica]|uniref:Alkyl sulfatase BDS1-like metallo-beta-lactamase superfamily hydrolase n=1 Tax=Amycolatopsis endophytica TaxID=860233 RepID=A0A853BBE6_9PSEU|nr:alkyl sulfatase dimerization domain-containing protein [Amycolatopsis endophytica]NYI92340.1 alkyl sulfatase BDS1-like metallo-beta-lactamase superfamily hydrolase [Amycolatopsis endophytica]
MSALLDLSARIIDSGDHTEPVNRITQELSELTDDVAVVESFSHCIAFRTGEGLVLFDASHAATGTQVVAALRGWSDAPVHTLVYTHGHLDHVGGGAAVLADARRRGDPAPRVVAHENVPRRFDRYADTDGYNVLINQRQFGWLADKSAKPENGAGELSETVGSVDRGWLPADLVRPDTLVRQSLELSVGGLDIELNHAKGETDDHLWAWLPGKRAVCTGDLLIWHFPNVGNPQKVQRYPHEWAQALRAILAKEPELLLPAHGLPIAGRARIATVLTEVADVLDHVVRETVALMNEGAPLNTILHTVSVPETALAKPYLRPLYDEPEFAVRNIWRLYGGWYDGNPARLKPPADTAVATELAALTGGVTTLVRRAEELASAGDFRLACQLLEWAADAEPADTDVHRARAAVYSARSEAETSLMAKGIFTYEARRSERVSAES